MAHCVNAINCQDLKELFSMQQKIFPFAMRFVFKVDVNTNKEY